jgi:5-methylcytosine-specific restriction endonuclease McrA
MSQLAELERAVDTIRRIVADLEPGRVRGDDAVAWLSALVEVERLGAAGRTLFAARVEASNVWRASGERSAAQFLAHTTGTSVGRAQSVLETAARLEALPATAQAFRAGRLSESQVHEVAAAAAVSPAAEGPLLERANRSTMKQLRDECRRVRHAGTDDEARYEAIRRNRYLRTWTDGEGAVCGQFRASPDTGARVLAALDAEIDRVFKLARREQRRESRAAYAMDALEALLGAGPGSAGKPARTVINVLVDYEALVRGHTVAGETCEIAGIGSLPVSVVAAWQRDAYLSLIVTHGIDIKAVTRATRYVDVDQRRALAVRDRSCVVQRCDAESRLQRDHRVPFARGGPTAIDNLQHLCPFHHALKTKGWRLTGGVGCYRLVPPDDGGRDPPE